MSVTSSQSGEKKKRSGGGSRRRKEIMIQAGEETNLIQGKKKRARFKSIKKKACENPVLSEMVSRPVK